MAFLGFHMSDNPGIGTVFVLMENGQISGQPKRDFPNEGEKFSTVGPDDLHRDAKVLNASAESLAIEMHDGTNLSLTPWRNGDLDLNFRSPMYHTFWTAR